MGFKYTFREETTEDLLVMYFILPFENKNTKELTGTYTQYELLKKWSQLKEKEIERLNNSNLKYFEEFAPDLVKYYENNLIDGINTDFEIKKYEGLFDKMKKTIDLLEILGKDTTDDKNYLEFNRTDLDNKLQKKYNETFILYKNELVKTSISSLNRIKDRLENINEIEKEIPFTFIDCENIPFQNIFLK